ncbi:hypothetical protein PM082_024818 [Marasmius tenuissimus]|nr:hypothetical protein PM082_024818 [Marasmius tenuissimus]
MSNPASMSQNPGQPQNPGGPMSPPDPPGAQEADEDDDEGSRRYRAPHQLFKKDLEKFPGILATKTALYVHVSVMMRRRDIYSLPLTPDDQTKEAFRVNREKIRKYLDQRSQLFTSLLSDLNDHAKELRRLMLNGKHSIVNISKLEEEAFRTICQDMAGIGLERFMPDLLVDAFSDWNTVHEKVLLRSFHCCIESGQYRYWAVNDDYVRNDSLMGDLYRHYVFFKLKGDCMATTRSQDPNYPDNLKVSDANFKQRKYIGKQRGDWFRQQGFSREVQNLMSHPDSVSEDEEAPGNEGIRYILDRPDRNPVVTSMARICDTACETARKWGLGVIQGTKMRKLGVAQPYKRIPHPGGWLRPPTWYHPHQLLVYRILSAAARGLWSLDAHAALSPDVTAEDIMKADPPHSFKEMDSKTFNRTYGEKALAPYTLPVGKALSKLKIKGKNSKTVQREKHRSERAGHLQQQMYGHADSDDDDEEVIPPFECTSSPEEPEDLGRGRSPGRGGQRDWTSGSSSEEDGQGGSGHKGRKGGKGGRGARSGRGGRGGGRAACPSAGPRAGGGAAPPEPAGAGASAGAPPEPAVLDAGAPDSATPAAPGATAPEGDDLNNDVEMEDAVPSLDVGNKGASGPKVGSEEDDKYGVEYEAFMYYREAHPSSMQYKWDRVRNWEWWTNSETELVVRQGPRNSIPVRIVGDYVSFPSPEVTNDDDRGIDQDRMENGPFQYTYKGESVAYGNDWRHNTELIWQDQKSHGKDYKQIAEGRIGSLRMRLVDEDTDGTRVPGGRFSWNFGLKGLEGQGYNKLANVPSLYNITEEQHWAGPYEFSWHGKPVHYICDLENTWEYYMCRQGLAEIILQQGPRGSQLVRLIYGVNRASDGSPMDIEFYNIDEEIQGYMDVETQFSWMESDPTYAQSSAKLLGKRKAKAEVEEKAEENQEGDGEENEDDKDEDDEDRQRKKAALEELSYNAALALAGDDPQDYMPHSNLSGPSTTDSKEEEDIPRSDEAIAMELADGIPQDVEAFKITFTAQAPTSAGPSAPAEQPSAPRFSFTPQVPTTSDPSAPTEASAQTPAEPPSAQAPQIRLAVPVTHQGQQLYYSVDPGQNHEW